MTDRLGDLLTEQVDDRYAGLDTASVAQLAVVMNDADATVPGAVRAALPQIVPAIEGIADRLAAGGRLLYVGAGTAGRLGVLDASECPPTFSTPPELVRAVIAGGTPALFAAQEGVEDDEAAGAEAIAECAITATDAVVGISASGRTPYVLAAVRAARQRDALTVGLSCNADTPLSAAADHGIEVLVGPEVLAGSTRLKAGTAQKLVLNMISTVSMIRLGKTYDNLMVDLRVTNAKLRDRAVRIIRRVTGAPHAEAEAALDRANLDVKTAILMLDGPANEADPRQRLAASGGRLRKALEASP
ncbi:N-acetylmuramic acid 6-phosphate etherase [Micromonospora sp. CB01531]|uniref:N-acetylmuramic acid 6-phosphate etherase n=1 Tax=Micromonospora sp. CB01531 TaxID=1718947 RepID=UPI00093C44FC|nr:N-acetylmuramic acid 6-phosphate etherase [Micromonospora sp. CB01531]OKI49023.1 N-acetylmuramic acid 6-phosphate etherase [Micromonospora sp. CB01531]